MVPCRTCNLQFHAKCVDMERPSRAKEWSCKKCTKARKAAAAALEQRREAEKEAHEPHVDEAVPARAPARPEV